MQPSLFDLISPAAFSSLWYWVVVALVWTRVAQSPFGVPIDLYDHARRLGGEDDVLALLRAGVGRHLAVSDRIRVWVVGGWSFLLSTLLGLAMMGLEIAQALLVLAVPLALAQLATESTARKMSRMGPELTPLMTEVSRLRLKLQGIGLASIFVSALYGVMQLLAKTVF